MAYGKVHGSFWRDMEDDGVSDGGMLLFLYLITCEHRKMCIRDRSRTILNCYR